MSTPLNQDELIQSFPDNVDGLIVPENMRDFVLSVELKYSNWIVVKSGQPTGNSFPDPDPVTGKRILEPATIYVINGDITTLETLVMQDETNITSLGGNVFNQITLDNASVFDYLIETPDQPDPEITYNFLIDSVSLVVTDATKSIFNIQNAGIMALTQVQLSADRLGEIVFPSTNGGGFQFEDVSVIFADFPLLFSGKINVARFLSCSNAGAGLFGTTSNVFDFAGATSLTIKIFDCISSCQNAGTFLFSGIDNSVVVEGIVTNSTNQQGIAGDFIEGITPTTLKWQWFSNSSLLGNTPTDAAWGAIAGTLSDQTDLQTALNAKQSQSEKGNANGYASLDASGRIPSSQLPTSSIEFKGSFGSGASTTGGDLPSSGNTLGDKYICDTNGYNSAEAGITFDTGDNALYDGSSWVKIDNNESVPSVFGRVGPILAQAGDYNKAQVGLPNVDDTSDLAKPISTDTQAALDDKLEAGDDISVLNNDAGYITEVITDDTLSGTGVLGDELTVNGIFGFADSSNFSRAGQTTEGLINQQNGVLEDYLELQFTAQRSKVHGIGVSFVWSLDSANTDFIAQLEISGSLGFSQVFTLPKEPSDSGGGGQVLNTLSGGVIGGNANTGTNQFNEIDITPRYFNLVAGEVYTVTLRWGASGAGLDAAIYNAQLYYKEEINS